MAIPEEQERIGDLLIDEGVITAEEVLAASTIMRGTALGRSLEEGRYPRRADLAAWIGSFSRPPYIEDMRQVDVNPRLADVVPAEVARRTMSIPLAKTQGILFVARAGLNNQSAVQELRKITGLRIKVLRADEAQVMAAIERLYGNKTIEIPEPKAVPAPASSSHAKSSIQDGPPLISMGGGDSDPTMASVSPVEAAKITALEYSAEERHPHVQLIRAWDALFLDAKATPAQRVG